jgi:hypothetical protein
MFSMSVTSRTARGLAAAALILSLTATTFAGSANAAPNSDETQSCKAAAHARNDATQLVHKAWKAFDGDLKDLAKDARDLQKESRKDKAGADLTKDARAEVASAKQELKSIASQAHEDIQAAVELGTSCKDEGDEDDTTTTTTTTTTSTSTTAPSDATAPADSTGSAHTFDTSGLDSKYKDIVEQAISDMQGVVDEATKAVADMAAAAESKDTTDDTKAKKKLETAKADRETAKADREEAKTAAKDKSTDKSNAKSSNSGKGHDGQSGKGRR